jgi:glycolate oxidase iron-sulfur subunit
MQTNLADFIKDTPEGREADAILRTCVHCGFCTAVCPTYQLLGDELDGPRGRIYLIKQMLEGQPVTEKTQLHLDRCLSCRSCETTCPSGVKYHRLLDIGRDVMEKRVGRSLVAKAVRFLLSEALPRPWIFKPAVKMGQLVRPLLPSVLADKVPMASEAALKPWPQPRAHKRRMIALAGCVQPTLTPNTNAATARVLDKLGIELFEPAGAGCCGAHVLDYGSLFKHDAAYAEKAARITALTRDASEVIAAEKDRLVELLRAASVGVGKRVAFHSPCTLQHGLKIRGVVESLLAAAGYELSPVADPHLCCGSAGTYSITQPELSKQLRDNKLAALGAGSPAVFVTANIGCQTHLQSGSATPVLHWIELIDERLGN